MRDRDIGRRGIMFVLSSPSGAGKTTISRKLLEQDRNIRMSVSVTTRAMRPGEVDGQDYSFVSREEFSRMTLNRELLEHAQVFDHYYGTPRKPVEQALETGHDVLFDIDWQGTRQLKRITREDMVSVFILPPSIGELERRLKSRAQDSDAVVANRMEKSIAEIRHWDEYDYVLINHDLDETSTKVSAILRAERLWRKRRHGLAEFVATLEQEALARDLGAA